MKIVFGVVACLVVSVSGLCLVNSVRPDLYTNFLGFSLFEVFLPLTLPFIIVAIVYVLNMFWREKKENRKHVLGLLIIITLTIGLLVTQIPVRIAFAASQLQLEEVLTDLPESDDWRISINRRAGWFFIADYEEDYGDRRVYLIADRRGDGAVLVTYGFCRGTETDCLSPNEHTDYEGAGYKATKLGDGWYWFRFSENW